MDVEKMDYWDVKKELCRIIPRTGRLFPAVGKTTLTKQKGRKSNYKQYNLVKREWEKLERLLNTEEISSFLEVSLRAQSCPLPLNLDVWDGLICPYRCKYCFADYFRASLYSSFFDNYKDIGLRYCNTDYFKSELDKIFKYRGKKTGLGQTELRNAVGMEMPVRFGIRFEDFHKQEGKKGIAKDMLNYLADEEYPVMINTKSDLLGRDDYLEALARNPAKSAIHITMISGDSDFLREIEPGAPTLEQRLESAKALVKAGVRVVARIEPFMVFLNDQKEYVDRYIQLLQEAGIQHITWDTYSYSAYSEGIARNFTSIGYDFERMFMASSDSQWLGSIMMGKLMEYFRKYDFICATFDFGNATTNDDPICCCVGDWFETGNNHGSLIQAINYIVSRGKRPTSWSDYNSWVEAHGGWLSESIMNEVRLNWNLEGNVAWNLDWAAGLKPVGQDEEGQIWIYRPGDDFRIEYLRHILR